MMPSKVLSIELTEPAPTVQLESPYKTAWILVTHHLVPVGFLYLYADEEGCIDALRLQKAVQSRLQKTVLALAAAPLPQAPATEPFQPAVSVVVCTRNRTAWLKNCLEGLLLLTYSPCEIIVVDNAPSTDETKQLVSTLPVRYVREERPGLDYARNRGIAEARHGIVAFIDDDARPGENWLHALVENFRRSDVMAVSGFVAPAELETPAQHLFELNLGGMGHGFQRRFFRKPYLRTNDLLSSYQFGIGTNMAFRKAVFEQTGPFDPALDVGMPSGGGGDVEMFHRLVAGGHCMVYDPAVVVWHKHRRDEAALRRQIGQYGVSFGCHLLTCWRNRTVPRRSIIWFVAASYLRGHAREFLKVRSKPRRLVLLELAQFFISPFAYWRSQRRVAKLEKQLR